jgi:flagellar hook protein FlgE
MWNSKSTKAAVAMERHRRDGDRRVDLCSHSFNRNHPSRSQHPMSVISTMSIAVSGLDAQTTALNNIANNIAGSSTVAYKQAETDFETLVLGGGATASPDLGGVSTSTRLDISTAGQVQTTGVATDIAINGNGFMVVNSNANAANGNYLLTQAGSFRPDAKGNLVNAAGYYLQGQPLDAAGNVIGTPASTVSGLSTVNISNLSVASTPTTSMTFTANLPSSETQTFSAATATPSSTAVTYYDSLGTAQTLTFQFVPTQPAGAGAAPTNTWTMNILDSASTTPATPIGQATMTFNGTGADAGMLSSVTPVGGGTYDPAAGTYTISTGDGQTIPITIGALNSPGGITQLDGSYTTTKLQNDGSPFGLMQSVSIGNDGVVTASFSNGATRPIYQMDVAVVPNPDGLTPVTGDAYSLSPAAGVAQLYQPGQGPAGTTDGGTLEGSNVDLSTELTNLIETQRAYSSNATVIQTANQMLQTLTTIFQ